MANTTQNKSAQKITTTKQALSEGIDAVDVAIEGFEMLQGIISALGDKGATDTEKQLAKAGWHIASDYGNLIDCYRENLQKMQGGES